MSVTGYKTCQSCEQLSNELNYLRDVDMKDLKQNLQYACKIISDLLDIAYRHKSTETGDAERFYRDHFIPADEPGSGLSNYIDDELPF